MFKYLLCLYKDGITIRMEKSYNRRWKNLRIGIMQPYFWPYLGYFQLLRAVDKYVIYDNIEYTKKGWFNRNRYLCNGQAKYFTIPIARASDYSDVINRKTAANFDRAKIKNQIKMAYQKAPFFENIFWIFCECVDCQNENLFEYIFYSVKKIAEYLDIGTEIIVSSKLEIGHELKKNEKVLEICHRLDADEYLNPYGGKALYDKEEFKKEGIQLSFLQMENIVYQQFDNSFVELLSILDVLMFNSKEKVKNLLDRYTIS